MSTPGGIFRPLPDGGIIGVGHRFDSYAEGLGQTLFNAYHTTFHRDLDEMRKYFIDDHPGGWYTVVGRNLDLLVATEEVRGSWHTPREKLPPECYCHTMKYDELHRLKALFEFGYYAYVLEDDGLRVYASSDELVVPWEIPVDAVNWDRFRWEDEYSGEVVMRDGHAYLMKPLHGFSNEGKASYPYA